jgi:raffinose/stachyose/melibiose transport system substrate-binding protein
MKKWYKSSVNLMLFSGLIFLICSCSASKQKSSANINEISAESAAAYYRQYPKETAGKIEFYQQKAEAEDIFDEFIKDFAALYPNITVEQNVQQDASAVLQTRVASGEFTDVWLYYPDAIYATFVNNGWIMDITDEPFVKYSVENIQEWYEYNGRMYGVPVTMNSGGIICNRGMFEKNGIALPDNWESFMAACQAFKNKGINPLILTIKSGADNSHTMVWGNYVTIEQVRQVARGEVKLSEIPAWSEAIDKMLEMYAYGQPNAISTDYNDGLTNFANEEGAMFISGTWTFNAIAGINPDLDFVQVPMPANKSYVACGIDVGFSIGARTKYPEACKAFVNWLASPEVAQRYAEADNAVPAIKGVAVSDPRFEMTAKAIAEGKAFNWPTTAFPTGGAFDAFFQRISTFYADRNKTSFMRDVDDIMSGKK